MNTVQKAVIQKGDKILVIKRPPTSRYFPEHWDFPGGRLEEGERRVDGLIREVAEETSLTVEIDQIASEFSIDIQGDLHNYTIYTTKHVQGEIKLSHEHTEFQWLTKEEILEQKIEPFIRKFLENM